MESAVILTESLKTSLKRARFIQRNDLGGGGIDGNVLEIKLKELKDERAELYKQQGLQATHLLSLNDQLRNRDSALAALNTEIANLKAAQGQKDEEIRGLREKIRESENGAKIIGDELVALQLELLRLDQWQAKIKDNNCNSSTKSVSVYSLKNSKTKFDGDNEGEEEEKSKSSFLSDPALNLTIEMRNNANKKLMKLVKEKEIIAPHQYPISLCASRPPLRLLLTGSEDQKIIVYDLTRISTKIVLKWSKMNGPIVGLAINEEGNRVASCSAYDKEITIWNLGSGKIINTLQFSDGSSDNGNSSNGNGNKNSVEGIINSMHFFSLYLFINLLGPILQFGHQFRLWMSLERSVRLWDCERGLLLRSWSKEQIANTIRGKETFEFIYLSFNLLSFRRHCTRS